MSGALFNVLFDVINDRGTQVGDDKSPPHIASTSVLCRVTYLHLLSPFRHERPLLKACPENAAASILYSKQHKEAMSVYVYPFFPLSHASTNA
ncbi:unnamed protein product [Strongylus vulgaris]|uniref:Uncharacterized protein n=1 Tax=Strongylus vulgaris TaxID=40348 RepID=A0A3P7JIV3_STRVU|nr:unnamed protein product [Strongylus vulgaris]